jgi:transcriptional regulator with XRE-family HTH domain
VERRQRLLKRLGNLRRIRSERSLTVEVLSKRSGVPRSTIVGLEEGTRKTRQVTKDKAGQGARRGGVGV